MTDFELTESASPDFPEFQARMGRESDAVLRLGMLCIGAGTNGYRVIRAMKRAARALGFDNVDAIVGVTEITATFHKSGAFRTVVARQDSPSVDSSRIEALNNLTHQLHRRITADELNEKLDNVESQVRKRWPWWLISFSAALACAAFAVLNHFSPLGVLIVAVSAGCGQSARYICNHFRVQQIGGIAAGASAACLIFLGIILALRTAGVPGVEEASASYVAAVLFLIPGFPLFSSFIDLARFDFIAGLQRMAYALVVIITATMTVAMTSMASGLNPEPISDSGNFHSLWILAVATFFGISGFALLFNSSKRMILSAALVGVVANILRLMFQGLGYSEVLATFIGGLIIGLLGSVFANTAQLPRITTTVPAALIMIPGTSIFRAMFYFNDGEIQHALKYGTNAVVIVFAISAGLVLARLLTDRDWALGHHIDLHKQLSD